MYDIENQVCTLEQAKELKELGLELDSYFVWGEYDDFCMTDNRPELGKTWRVSRRCAFGDNPNNFPAYNCAELGVLMPWKIPGVLEASMVKSGEENEIILVYAGYEDYIRFCYEDHYGSIICDDDTKIKRGHEAHAKADLFIQLLKDKFIKPENLKL